MVKVHPTGYERGENKTKTKNVSFSRSSLIVTSSPDVILATPPLTPVSTLGHSCELCVVAGVHKFTSRTSVGVLDWSCCSLALFPALILASCWYCWPCCRLVASTRSICSWQALRQSCNKKESDIIGKAHIPVKPLLIYKGLFCIYILTFVCQLFILI